MNFVISLYKSASDFLLQNDPLLDVVHNALKSGSGESITYSDQVVTFTVIIAKYVLRKDNLAIGYSGSTEGPADLYIRQEKTQKTSWHGLLSRFQERCFETYGGPVYLCCVAVFCLNQRVRRRIRLGLLKNRKRHTMIF